jgi:SOS response regulatory protein OraA/RecX
LEPALRVEKIGKILFHRGMQSIKAKAFSLLAKKSYFSKELKKKLLEKKYPEGEIDALLEALRAQGWINDRELAERFAQRQRDKGYGRRVIAQKLKEKAGELELDLPDPSREELTELIERRYGKKLPQERERVIRSLLRRGFSYDLILNAIKNYTED